MDCKPFVTCSAETPLAGLLIPPFAISAGGVLSFGLPCLAGGRAEREFRGVLAGERESPGIKVRTRAAVARPYAKELGALRVGRIPLIDALVDKADAAVGERLLGAMGDTVSSLPATPRLHIGVHLACLESAFVVFDSAGADPLGVEALLGYVRKRAAEGMGFAHFAFPLARYGAMRPAARESGLVVIEKLA